MDLDRRPFQRGLDAARRDAQAFEKRKWTAKVAVDVDSRQLTTLQARLKSLRNRSVTINALVNQLTVSTNIQMIAQNTATTARRSASTILPLLVNLVIIHLGQLPEAPLVAAG